MKAITLEEAKKLTKGTLLFEIGKKNADGSPKKWKVNGEVETWKLDSARISVPIKHGLRMFSHVTEKSLWAYSLTNK